MFLPRLHHVYRRRCRVDGSAGWGSATLDFLTARTTAPGCAEYQGQIRPLLSFPAPHLGSDMLAQQLDLT